MVVEGASTAYCATCKEYGHYQTLHHIKHYCSVSWCYNLLPHSHSEA